MKWTRERKVYCAMLAVALGGLAIDQVFLKSGALGPEQAKANVTATVAAAATPTPAARPQVGPIPTLGAAPRLGTTPAPASMPMIDEGPRVSIAQTIADTAAREKLSLDSIDDAFAPGDTWQFHAPAAPTPTVDPIDQKVERFRQERKLTAVMKSGGDAIAVIDGKAIRVGQYVDGMQLVGVDQQTARFEQAGRAVTLTVPSAADR